MIKQENLDFYLVQVFGKAPLEAEEFKSFSAVLSGQGDRLFLTSQSSALKPYLIGACLPGAMIAVYEAEEPARQAADALAATGVCVRFLPTEFSPQEFDSVVAGLGDGSIRVLIGPTFPLADMEQGGRIVMQTASIGLNLVVVHDLLAGAADVDGLIGKLQQIYPREAGACVARALTGEGGGPAFPVPEKVPAILGGLTDEERDELLKPIPRAPAPPLPAQAYEPEIDEEEGQPTVIRSVSPQDVAALAAADRRGRAAPAAPTQAEIDESALLSTLDSALAPADAEPPADAPDEMGVDLESLLGANQAADAPTAKRAVVKPGLPGAPTADDTSLAGEITADAWAGDAEAMDLSDLTNQALQSFDEPPVDKKAEPELFVPRRAAKPPPSTPPPPPVPSSEPEVDPLDAFLEKKTEEKAIASEMAELDDLLGIGKGAEDAPEADEATLANLQQMLSGGQRPAAPVEDVEATVVGLVADLVAPPPAEDATLDPSFEAALSAAIEPVVADAGEMVEVPGVGSFEDAGEETVDAAASVDLADLLGGEVSVTEALATDEPVSLEPDPLAAEAIEGLDALDAMLAAPDDAAPLEVPAEPQAPDVSAEDLAVFDAAAAMAGEDFGAGVGEVEPEQPAAVPSADDQAVFDAAAGFGDETIDAPVPVEVSPDETIDAPLDLSAFEDAMLAGADAAVSADDAVPAGAWGEATGGDGAALDASAFEEVPTETLDPGQVSEMPAEEYVPDEAQLAAEQALASLDGDELLMPTLEAAAEDEAIAPTVAVEPRQKPREVEDDFDAEMMNALKMANLTDEEEPTPQKKKEAAPVVDQTEDEELARSLITEIDELTRTDAAPRKDAPVAVAVAVDDDEPVSLALDGLEELSGDALAGLEDPAAPAADAAADPMAAFDSAWQETAPAEGDFVPIEGAVEPVPDALEGADALAGFEMPAEGADALAGYETVDGADALAGFETPAEGADALAGFEMPAEGADALAGYDMPVEGADALAGLEAPMEGADALAGYEVPADGADALSGLEGADALAGYEIPADGEGADALAGYEIPADGADALSGLEVPVEGADALAGYEIPADGADVLAGLETPSDGADAPGGYEIPADSADALAGLEIPADGGDALAGLEIPADGGDALGGFEMPAESADALAGLEIPADGGDALGGFEMPADDAGGDALDGLELPPTDGAWASAGGAGDALDDATFAEAADALATAEPVEAALAEGDEPPALADDLVAALDQATRADGTPAEFPADAGLALADAVAGGEAPAADESWEAPLDLAGLEEPAAAGEPPSAPDDELTLPDDLLPADSALAAAAVATLAAGALAADAVSDDELIDGLRDLEKLDELEAAVASSTPPTQDRPRYVLRPPPPPSAPPPGAPASPVVLELPRVEAQRTAQRTAQRERAARPAHASAAIDATASLDLFAAVAAAAAASVAGTPPSMREAGPPRRPARPAPPPPPAGGSKVLEISYWQQEAADILSGLSALSGAVPAVDRPPRPAAPKPPPPAPRDEKPAAPAAPAAPPEPAETDEVDLDLVLGGAEEEPAPEITFEEPDEHLDAVEAAADSVAQDAHGGAVVADDSAVVSLDALADEPAAPAEAASDEADDVMRSLSDLLDEPAAAAPVDASEPVEAIAEPEPPAPAAAAGEDSDLDFLDDLESEPVAAAPAPEPQEPAAAEPAPDIDLAFLDDDKPAAAPAAKPAAAPPPEPPKSRPAMKAPSFLDGIPGLDDPAPAPAPAAPPAEQKPAAPAAAPDAFEELERQTSDLLSDLLDEEPGIELPPAKPVAPEPAPSEDPLADLDRMLSGADDVELPAAPAAPAAPREPGDMDSDLAELTASFATQKRSPEPDPVETPLPSSLSGSLEAVLDRMDLPGASEPADPLAGLLDDDAAPATPPATIEDPLAALDAELDRSTSGSDELADLSDLLNEPGSAAPEAAPAAMDKELPSFLSDAPTTKPAEKSAPKAEAPPAAPLPEVADQARAASRKVIEGEAPPPVPPPAPGLASGSTPRKTQKVKPLASSMLGMFQDAPTAPDVPEEAEPAAPAAKPPPPPPAPAPAAHGGHGGHGAPAHAQTKPAPPPPSAPSAPVERKPFAAPSFLDDSPAPAAAAKPTPPPAPAPAPAAPAPESDPLSDLSSELEDELNKVLVEQSTPAAPPLSDVDAGLESLFGPGGPVAPKVGESSLDDLFGPDGPQVPGGLPEADISFDEPVATAPAMGIPDLGLELPDEDAFVELPSAPVAPAAPARPPVVEEELWTLPAEPVVPVAPARSAPPAAPVPPARPVTPPPAELSWNLTPEPPPTIPSAPLAAFETLEPVELPLPAATPIDRQVSDVLKDVLSEYPDEMVLKPAAPEVVPAPEPPAITPTVDWAPVAPAEPARPVDARPPMIPPIAMLAGAAPVATAAATPPPAPAWEPELPPIVERPAAPHRPEARAEAPVWSEPPPPPHAPEPARRAAPPPPPPAAVRDPEDIRKEFDLPREGHHYFYELAGGYELREDYLRRIWDDPDSSVDALVALLPDIEKSFPNDPRVAFAIAVFNMLSERRVASLVAFNRALDLLDAHQDYAGAAVILRLLNRTFPDDVGVTERLVDVLERLGQKVEAAHILDGLARSAMAREQGKRALAYLERAALLDPNNVEVALAQVKLYREAAADGKALEAANRGLAARPDDPAFLLYKAQALHTLGRARAAETCMDKAIARASGDLAMLKMFAGELRAAHDHRDLKRVQEMIDRLEPPPVREVRPIEPAPEPVAPSTPAPVAAPPAPHRPAVAPSPLPPLTVAPPAYTPAPPAYAPPEPPRASAPPEPAWTPSAGDDVFTRLRQKHARFGADARTLSDLDADLKARQARGEVEDRQVVDLLRKIQAIGDKIKAQAPEEASLLFQHGLTYLAHFRDPFMAMAWRDDLEKRLKLAPKRA